MRSFVMVEHVVYEESIVTEVLPSAIQFIME